jgi:membrane associated rhomboid family serine protease
MVLPMANESGPKRQRLLRAASELFIVLSVIGGVVGVVACFMSEQYGPMIAVIVLNAIVGVLGACARRSARVRDDT